MKNARDLFLFRLKKEWNYQYGVWKTAVDWIVWLYILIPVLAILGYNYYLLWQGTVQWIETYPPFLIWFSFFFLTRIGTVRLFVQEGDLLFLRRQSQWLHRLMKLGVGYTLLRNAIILAIYTALLLPILQIYIGASVTEIILFISFVFLLQLFVQLSRQLLGLRYRRWKYTIINAVFLMGSLFLFQGFLFSGWILRGLIALILTAVVVWFLTKRLTRTNSFFEDCLRENQERLKLTTLFIGASGYKLEKKQRKRPIILFFNSAKLFKNRTTKNLAAEVFMKLFMRNKSKLMAILQITGASMIAIWISPLWVKWVLLVVCLFAVVQYIKWGWRDMRTHSFLTLFPKGEHDQLLLGIKKGIFLLGVPSFLLLGLTTGWTAMSFLAGIAVALGSVLFSYFFFIKDTWLN